MLALISEGSMPHLGRTLNWFELVGMPEVEALISVALLTCSVRNNLV